ncbi:MAG: hypothetical protein JSR73_10955 [Proteobacteria bacterium]|nr:hypothetical protein [Pseudomonadota bacterium]
MDHAARRAPTPFTDAPAQDGWDAAAVWRERVRDGGKASRARPKASPERAGGWDPLQTWRQRVRRPGA